jgi:hypothetical protein
LFVAAVCYGVPAFAAPQAKTETSDTFVSADQFYMTNALHQGTEPFDFYGAVHGLEKQFDFICGDTFCEGEYSNLRPLDLDCSVNEATQLVASCVWTFAGSYTDVDVTTGHIEVQSAVKTCDLGFVGNAKTLATFLRQASRPGKGRFEGLREVKIPGRDKALMEVLTDCF